MATHRSPSFGETRRQKLGASTIFTLCHLDFRLFSPWSANGAAIDAANRVTHEAADEAANEAAGKAANEAANEAADRAASRKQTTRRETDANGSRPA